MQECTTCHLYHENEWHSLLECPAAQEVWQEVGLMTCLQPHLDRAEDFNEAVFNVLSKLSRQRNIVDGHDSLELMVVKGRYYF